MTVVLDTNIIILYLHDDVSIVRWVDSQRLRRNVIAISTMTVVELLSFPRISPEEVFSIEQWLRDVLVIDVDLSIARESALLRRQTGLTTTDSIIAATAVLLKASLATRDVAFKKIRDVSVLVP